MEKVKNIMIKHGNNPTDVDEMLKEHYATAKRIYPHATPSKLAEVIRTYSSYN